MSFIEELKRGVFRTMYLVHGTEQYIIDHFLKNLMQSIPEEDLDFNLSIYDLEETSIQTAIEEAETTPFLGESKIVICKKAAFLTAEKDKSKEEHNIDRLFEYIHNPAPHTSFVLIAPYEKLDKRKKITKTLLKEAAVVEAAPSNGNDAERFVQDLAKELNVTVTSNGCGRLLQMVGNNLTMLDNEVRKLAMYIGEQGTIDENIVDSLVAQTLEQNVFTLVDKVINRKFSDAYSILRNLLKQNEEPIRILALLTRQIRIILYTQIFEEHGLSQKEIASKLGLHPYAVKVASEQGKKFTRQQLFSAIEKCVEADYGMKSGQNKQLQLELFISSL